MAPITRPYNNLSNYVTRYIALAHKLNNCILFLSSSAKYSITNMPTILYTWWPQTWTHTLDHQHTQSYMHVRAPNCLRKIPIWWCLLFWYIDFIEANENRQTLAKWKRRTKNPDTIMCAIPQLGEAHFISPACWQMFVKHFRELCNLWALFSHYTLRPTP